MMANTSWFPEIPPSVLSDKKRQQLGLAIRQIRESGWRVQHHNDIPGLELLQFLLIKPRVGGLVVKTTDEIIEEWSTLVAQGQRLTALMEPRKLARRKRANELAKEAGAEPGLFQGERVDKECPLCYCLNRETARFCNMCGSQF